MRAAPGGRHHGAVEPPLRREDAGRVDQDDLRVVLDHDAADQRARGLHLARDDRDLGADQRVDQRRLADIGRADQRDEAAARVAAGTLSAVQLSLPPPTPSRSIITEAATFSAARLLPPTPSAGVQARQLDRDAELRIVMRPGALDLAIDRRRQALALRPFLQHGLGIAQRPRAACASARSSCARRIAPPPHSRRRERSRRSRLRRCRRARICASARWRWRRPRRA